MGWRARSIPGSKTQTSAPQTKTRSWGLRARGTLFAWRDRLTAWRCTLIDTMEIAYIGLGGNVASAVGVPEVTLASAAEKLNALGRVMLRSRLYSTMPVGYAEQPRFVNAVVALETRLEARALLDALLGIEREFGRDRSHAIPNGPRTLDLDILLYGSHLLREPEMEIPHPRLAERAFVLVPLNEIAPEVIVPGLGRSVSQLLAALKMDAADAVMPLESDACGPVWKASLRG